MTRSSTLKRLVFLLFLILLTTASTSFACWGPRMTPGTPGPHNHVDLTTEQQQHLDGIQEKYADKLDKLQTALNSKSEEYQQARANDRTTVGSLKRLEAEIGDLEQQYWTLLDQANSEAGEFLGGETRPWFHCGYRQCNHQSHWNSQAGTHHMGAGPAMRMNSPMRRGCWWN